MGQERRMELRHLLRLSSREMHDYKVPSVSGRQIGHVPLLLSATHLEVARARPDECRGPHSRGPRTHTEESPVHSIGPFAEFELLWFDLGTRIRRLGVVKA